MRNVSVAVFAAGAKGAAFLAALAEDRSVDLIEVQTYDQAGTLDQAVAQIRDLCGARGVPFHLGRRPAADLAPQAELVFVVGWQYLLPPDPRIVVFHDSLLPRYRGFAPTVTALINGESEIGVTALRPVEAPDAGPIVAQHSLPVTYPATIRDVSAKLVDLYVACAQDVTRGVAGGTLEETPQDHERATYSIWRADDDYLIDWSMDAARVCRTIDALGWPYPGARTIHNSENITLVSAIRGPDLAFEIVQAGKIWAIANGRPTVVCGTGTVVITEARNSSGDLVSFERLRARLG